MRRWPWTTWKWVCDTVVAGEPLRVSQVGLNDPCTWLCRLRGSCLCISHCDLWSCVLLQLIEGRCLHWWWWCRWFVAWNASAHEWQRDIHTMYLSLNHFEGNVQALCLNPHSVSAPLTLCLHPSLCVCTSHSVSAPLTLCLHPSLCVLTLTLCLHPSLCVCIPHSVSAHLTLCLHPSLCVCTPHSVSASLTLCLHTSLCVCTPHSVSSPVN
jgi:hypothetical protein